MADLIASFDGRYRFLSNFAPSPLRVRMLGLEREFPTVEHAFQASKILVTDGDRMRWLLNILEARTPAIAKRLGHRIPLHVERWDEIAPEVMRRLLLAKFDQNPDLRARLIATGDAVLVEGNTWGDRRWGMVDGEGENLLGILLMQVREHLRGAVVPKDVPALTVKCPKCQSEAGVMCVYMPVAVYPGSRSSAERASREGTPTKRVHAERQNVLTQRRLKRLDAARIAPLQTPAAVQAIRDFDMREHEAMRAWLRENGRLLLT